MSLFYNKVKPTVNFLTIYFSVASNAAWWIQN